MVLILRFTFSGSVPSDIITILQILSEILTNPSYNANFSINESSPPALSYSRLRNVFLRLSRVVKVPELSPRFLLSSSALLFSISLCLPLCLPLLPSYSLLLLVRTMLCVRESVCKCVYARECE